MAARRAAKQTDGYTGPSLHRKPMLCLRSSTEKKRDYRAGIFRRLKAFSRRATLCNSRGNNTEAAEKVKRWTAFSRENGAQ